MSKKTPTSTLLMDTSVGGGTRMSLFKDMIVTSIFMPANALLSAIAIGWLLFKDKETYNKFVADNVEEKFINRFCFLRDTFVITPRLYF